MLLLALNFDADSDKNNNLRLEEAIQKVADGDVDSIGTVYDLTKTALYGYILSILKNVQDTEDVLQDTYIKICQSASLYSSQGKPMAWIYIIARNLALMKIRAQSRYTDLEEFEWENIVSKNENFRVEDKMVLSTALKKLSEEECQIVFMHVLGGLKHREIAEICDLALPTVLSKYNRAISKLKRYLDN